MTTLCHECSTIHAHSPELETSYVSLAPCDDKPTHAPDPPLQGTLRDKAPRSAS